MRKNLENYFVENAEKDNMILLLADLGNYPNAIAAHPERVVNVGCMESGMVNFAVGLAQQGFHVLIYSVAGFTIHKAYDQLKMMVPEIKNKGKITIFNSGAGMCYNQVGRGHYLLDDLALMSPISLVYLPKCQDELLKSFEDIRKKHWNLSYIRGTFDNVPLYMENKKSIDEPELRIMTTPTMFQRVCDICSEEGIDAEIKTPFLGLNTGYNEAQAIIVIEDHQEIGGLADNCRAKGHHVLAHVYTRPFVDKASTRIEDVYRVAGIGTMKIRRILKECLKR